MCVKAPYPPRPSTSDYGGGGALIRMRLWGHDKGSVSCGTLLSKTIGWDSWLKVLVESVVGIGGDYCDDVSYVLLRIIVTHDEVL